MSSCYWTVGKRNEFSVLIFLLTRRTRPCVAEILIAGDSRESPVMSKEGRSADLHEESKLLLPSLPKRSFKKSASHKTLVLPLLQLYSEFPWSLKVPEETLESDLTLQVLSALETKLGSLRSSIISSRRSIVSNPELTPKTTILSSSDSSSEEQWTITPTSSPMNLPQPETPSSSSTSRPSPSTRTAAKSELSKTRR